MLINEKGLVRNIKRAFKGEGYTVQNLGDQGAGVYAETPKPLTRRAFRENQFSRRPFPPYGVDGGYEGRFEQNGVPAEAQRSGFGGERRNAGMGEFSHIDENERYGGRSDVVVLGEDRLMWDGDGEVVVIDGVRKACSGWAKEWERVCWGALESVNLHKEENA